MAGIGIRSAISVGLPSGGKPLDLWNGAMRGLAQGVASIGLNYLTQEFDLPPLLANIGFAAISAGIEGLIMPADPNNPAGPKIGMMENIWEKFTGNVLNMLGYNPIPDRTNEIYKNPDGTFNQTLFNSDMGNYYWQRSIYWFVFFRDKI